MEQETLRKVRQAYSLERYNKLLNAYDCPLPDSLSLPEYYAGAYLNDDGDLVILTTDTDSSVCRKIRQATGGDGNVIIQPARYSYNMVRGTVAEIYNFLSSCPEHPVAKNISQVAPYDDQNCIVVYLHEYSQEQVALCRQHLPGASYITYAQAPPMPEEELPDVQGRASINCGASFYIWYQLDGKSVSAGYVTTLNGIKLGDFIEGAQSGWVGNVIRVKDGPNIRHGFVKLEDNASLSIFNYTCSSKRSVQNPSEYQNNVVQGASVTIEHYNITPSTGKIKATGVVQTNLDGSGNTYYGLVLADYTTPSKNGYGGIVYTEGITSTVALTAGSHVAASANGSLFSPIKTIANELNLKI